MLFGGSDPLTTAMLAMAVIVFFLVSAVVGLSYTDTLANVAVDGVVMTLANNESWGSVLVDT